LPGQKYQVLPVSEGETEEENASSEAGGEKEEGANDEDIQVRCATRKNTWRTKRRILTRTRDIPIMENKRQKNEDDEGEDNEMSDTAAATVPVEAVRRKNLLLTAGSL
jgi:hypothetical protein